MCKSFCKASQVIRCAWNARRSKFEVMRAANWRWISFWFCVGDFEDMDFFIGVHSLIIRSVKWTMMSWMDECLVWMKIKKITTYWFSTLLKVVFKKERVNIQRISLSLVSVENNWSCLLIWCSDFEYSSYYLSSSEFPSLIKKIYLFCSRIFGMKRCFRCQATISSTELVMRAQEYVYHVACFSCSTCSNILTKGKFSI